MYTGARMTFETTEHVGRRKTLRSELDEYITPKPNNTVLGMRPGLWWYGVAGTPRKKKGLRSFIRNKLGQPPVLLRDVDEDRVARLLQGQLNNEGYFQSRVTATVHEESRTASVTYRVQLHPPYRLRHIVYPTPRDSTYAAVMRRLYTSSLLKPRQRYQLDNLQAEQQRIEQEVKNLGFYYFDDRYLIFEADSTVGNAVDGRRRMDLTLRMEDGIPDRAREIYRLKQVSLYPAYRLDRDSLSMPADTSQVDGLRYIDAQHAFRSRVLARLVNLRPGNIYRREDQDYTLRHLLDLGVFKYVNIRFEDVSTDSAYLDGFIYLTPLRKKSLRAEVQTVSKSNNFVGPGLSLTYTNRNFLRGAELFQMKISASYEAQVSRKTSGPLNAFELGITSSLTIPRLMVPVRIPYYSTRYVPKTQIRLSYNTQNRVGYFRLNTINAAFGYTWRESPSRSHELFLMDLNYVRTDKTSPEFREYISGNPILTGAFENQFIAGTRYTFTLNTQMRENLLNRRQQSFKIHSFYLTASADLAGNTLRAVQHRVKGEQPEPYQLLGSPYAQYIKGEVDFRHYWQFGRRDKLVSRLVIGIGNAYGNASTLPYIKQFAVGGSNSIRAFPARSVGPGTYNVRSDTSLSRALFIDQRGDIKLEGNVEYRFDIFRVIKGAWFIDAGNIWTWREDPARPGSKFHREHFLQELAVGTGFGLRFDFSFFVLRTDLAFPIRKPYLPAHQRWVWQGNGNREVWGFSNAVFNIAIGYPF